MSNNHRIDELVTIYQKWTEQQKEFKGIHIGSASEMLMIETLTSYQVNWLNRFIDVWDKAES